MWLDTALSYLHLLAILSWTVFLSSTAALMRPEWLNGAVVERLKVVDRIATMAGWLVVLTGLLRMGLSPKGHAWLVSQPWLWLKLALVAVMLVAGWRTTREIKTWHRQWQASQALPDAEAIGAGRRRVMRAAHLMLVLPLLGVLLARGVTVL
jgi:putative membrane protein